MSITTSLPSYGDRWVIIDDDGTELPERYDSREAAKYFCCEGQSVELLPDYEP